jgi:hypothetical protein
VEASDEVVEVGPCEGVGFEGEVEVGAEVVDPEGPGSGGGAGGFAVEEEDVGLDAVGVEDAGGETEQGVDVALVEEFAADGLAGAAFGVLGVLFEDALVGVALAVGGEGGPVGYVDEVGDEAAGFGGVLDSVLGLAEDDAEHVGVGAEGFEGAAVVDFAGVAVFGEERGWVCPWAILRKRRYVSCST